MFDKLRSSLSKKNSGILITLIFLVMGAVFSYYSASRATVDRKKEADVHRLQTRVAQEEKRKEKLEAALSPEAIEATKEAIARNEEGAVASGEEPVVPEVATPTPEPEYISTPEPSRAEEWWTLLFGK
jgi:hypothetical protein